MQRILKKYIPRPDYYPADNLVQEFSEEIDKIKKFATIALTHITYHEEDGARLRGRAS